MRITYPRGDQSRAVFLTDFIIAARKTRNDSPISASLLAAFEQVHADFQTAQKQKDVTANRVTRLTAVRKAAIARLRLLNRHAVTALKMQIEKGIYPATVQPAFGIPMAGFQMPRRFAEQVQLTQHLLEGGAYLLNEGLPPLVAPHMTELQEAVETAQALTTTLVAARNQLAVARTAMERVAAAVKELHIRGQRALDMATFDKSHPERREIKRNYGYRFRSDQKPQDTTGVAKRQ